MAESYNLTKFTADVTEIVQHENDAVKIVDAIKPLMAKIIEVDGFLPEQYTKPVSKEQPFGLYLIHKAPQDAFTVMSAIWPPNGGTPVHDHAGSWAVEVILDGSLHTKRFKRLDDDSRPGHAELRQTAELDIPARAIAHVIPPDQDVHQFTNITDRPVLSFHIYGGDITQQTRSRFTPEENAVVKYVDPLKYDNPA
jgi:predicted metal-dependent enzyme (double-stranded beta helix superfamily)